MVSGTNALAWSVLAATFMVLVHTSSASVNNNMTDQLAANTSTATKLTLADSTTEMHKTTAKAASTVKRFDATDAKHRNATKQFLSTGNELWDGLIRDCLRRPTFACFQKNVHSYLDHTLDLGDVNVTSRFAFTRNKVDYTKYTKEANERHHNDDDADNEIPDEEARSGNSNMFLHMDVLCSRMCTRKEEGGEG